MMSDVAFCFIKRKPREAVKVAISNRPTFSRIWLTLFKEILSAFARIRRELVAASESSELARISRQL